MPQRVVATTGATVKLREALTAARRHALKTNGLRVRVRQSGVLTEVEGCVRTEVQGWGLLPVSVQGVGQTENKGVLRHA